jgi:hypothetical protein
MRGMEKKSRLNSYERKLLKHWKGQRASFEFIGREKKIIEDALIEDVDVSRSNFMIQTLEEDILILGGLSMVRKTRKKDVVELKNYKTTTESDMPELKALAGDNGDK